MPRRTSPTKSPKIFVSWSQSPSKAIASAIKNWLLTLMDEVDVWISDEDIQLGEQWRESLGDALESSSYAILCITPQNMDSPWIAMEAGAIAMKGRNACRAVPLLFGIERHDLPSHLAGFQSIEASEQNLIRLAREIHEHVNSSTRPEVFDRRIKSHTRELWDELAHLMTIRVSVPELKQVRPPNALANFPNLVADVQAAPEVTLPNGKYQFHVFSVGERGTMLSHLLISEVKRGLSEIVRPLLPGIDWLVTVVPGGNPWALLIADQLGIPVEIIRDTESGTEEERMVWQKSLLYERKLYFKTDERSRAKRVLIIDDVVSSGGTVQLLTKELRRSGLEIVAVVAIILKGGLYKEIGKELGIDFFSILEVAEDYIKAGPRP
ncbi:TIR domain-containing protein [Luteolibacter ambystomatis]|uniref:TIR domain-containing protein n=1 Tax=Luteolibacter ambystomatis TaxID=2824561 RepID=A0A975G6P4_9BACT|nr:TIR domain-containing protein [Luteolibacter ambystomatis]QUE50329.1 TIR domain-containing protein [Luteolibacter ambystomatis]